MLSAGGDRKTPIAITISLMLVRVRIVASSARRYFTVKRVRRLALSVSRVSISSSMVSAAVCVVTWLFAAAAAVEKTGTDRVGQ